MQLYGFPASPFTRRVLVAARHLGIELEFVLVDLAKNAQRSPDYLKLNPNGLTPTLVDGDFVLWESNAILTYLCDVCPGEQLYPRDVQYRADVQRWLYWETGQLGDAVGPQVFELVIKPALGWGDPDQDKVDTARQQFERCAQLLDAELATREHIAGDVLTIADLAIASQVVRLLEIGQSLEQWPALHRWYRAVETLPAWEQVLSETDR